jgi:hypothetical protein
MTLNKKEFVGSAIVGTIVGACCGVAIALSMVREAKRCEDVKRENEALKKNLESLNNLVNKLFASKKAPSQKAITATSFIAKSEELETEGVNVAEMSKGEVTAKLKALDFQSLSNSDRDAINNFYLKNESVEKIKHLISK